MLVTYRGWLRLTDNTEEDGLLAIPNQDKEYKYDAWDEEFLARRIKDDMAKYGKYLSVQYWISDVALSEREIKECYLEQLYGIGKAKYNMHWSEDTGYLWTDEDLMVGGHDLLEELKSHVGKFVHMEISYNQEVKQ